MEKIIQLCPAPQNLIAIFENRDPNDNKRLDTGYTRSIAALALTETADNKGNIYQEVRALIIEPQTDSFDFAGNDSAFLGLEFEKPF